MAKHVGIDEAWYRDLEHDDDELASTLTLFQAMALASLLGVRLTDLLSIDDSPDEKIGLLELPARIRSHVAGAGITMEELERELAWELSEFLQSPMKGAAELPIVFLQALARQLGISWLSLVPDEDAG